MKLPLLLTFVLLAAVGLAGAADAKTSCVNKFLKFFSSFFAAGQVSGYAEVAMTQVVAHANSSKIVDAVIDAVMDNLTSSQYSQGSSLVVSAASKFGSYAAINETIQRCISGAAPVLLKLYPKITTKIQAASGQAAKMTAGYAYADKKFTQKLCKKLVKKCKKKLTADQWSKGTSLLKNYIHFDQLGVQV
ncbi:hypothetical protein M3Y99_01824400 [Aphelenchoides fujianensis]|nr:hypothetical protein M3Y99_01824400 [Aphelenchoides fujianensis]